jgi:hypothetical protein
MNELIQIHYHPSINFGDHLSVYLAEKLSGKKAYNVVNPEVEDHFMITGSILSLVTEKTTVWGAGIAYRSEELKYKPKEIVMVRGKYANDLLNKHGFGEAKLVGDPAYMLSKIYNPQKEKKYKLGVIAHWVDYEIAEEIFKDMEGVLIIGLMRDTELVLDDILSCEKCVSSSLHGIIASHAYGIPCLWVKFTDRILGDGTKYADYFSSVEIKEYQFLQVESSIKLNKLLSIIPQNTGNEKMIDKIYDSCPFKITN